MNKSDLVAVLSESKEITDAQAEAVVNSIVSNITDTIAKGGVVAISGFGVFLVSNRSARKGRNPATGETIDIPSKKVPKFKPYKELKEFVAD
jgi:DNA-binding protein HU-beta